MKQDGKEEKEKKEKEKMLGDMNMPNGLQSTKVNGSVVIIPEGSKAYLIADVTKAFGKEKAIIPFEKKLPERRIIEALSEAGARAEKITEKIGEIVKRKKAKELKEVV